MGRHELLEALQRDGQKTMAAITARGEAEKERLQAGAEQRRMELRRQYAQQSGQLCQELQRLIISKACREVALIRLRAEHSLALRLQACARSCVQQLHPDDPAALLRSLVAELPPVAWRTVRVNPAWAILAADCFPAAEIIADPALSFGLTVTAADDSLTVDNTLNTRLERLWPELLPQLLTELQGELS